jgi:UDP-GlcNAc:undecaprenyl-phosphate GlcNAc-1-phosphate transferase
MGSGLGTRRTLICLIALAATLAFFGSVIRMFGTETNLLVFGALVIAYTLTVTRVWARQEAQRNRLLHVQAANDADITSAAVIEELTDTPPDTLLNGG